MSLLFPYSLVLFLMLSWVSHHHILFGVFQKRSRLRKRPCFESNTKEGSITVFCFVSCFRLWLCFLSCCYLVSVSVVLEVLVICVVVFSFDVMALCCA